MSTHALITGATGFLGSHLVDVLLEAGATVRVLTRPGSDVARLERLPVAIVTGDAADDEILRRAVQGVDVVFHLAAYLSALAPFGVDGDDPRYRTVNVDFTERLLAAGREAGVQRFVFTSSGSVYGKDAPIPTPEEAPPRPGSAYARSKLQGEGLVRAARAPGFATTIVRPPLLYGPRDRYFTPLALRLARLPLLPLVDGGRHLLDLLYVRDAARFLWEASRAAVAANRTYNVGPGREVPLRDLVQAYQQVTGRHPRIVNVPSRWLVRLARIVQPVTRPVLGRLAPNLAAALTPDVAALLAQDYYLDTSRAQTDLGFRPRFSLRDGVAELLATG